MTKEKAFVDTTILTDVLLKPHVKGKIAKESLSKFKETELPVYAIKEFKAGPLNNFKWIHDKLAITGSFTDSLEALHRMSMTPKRYTTSTAIEALREAAVTLKGVTNQILVDKYGAKASPDATLCAIFRASIKTSIFKSWKARRSVTTNTAPGMTLRIEDDTKGRFFHLRCMSRNFEISIPPVFRKEFDATPPSVTQSLVVFDVDFFTQVQVQVGQLNIVEWIKQANNTVKRDAERFF